MRLIRAISLGILLWLLIFLWWVVMIMAWGQEGSLFLKWLIHFVLLIPASVLCARLYFKKIKRKGIGNGFFLGIIFLIVGFVLDIVITVPFFTGFYDYYNNPLLWIGFLELVILTSLVGGVSR